MDTITVIGCTNLDVLGRPTSPFILRDSVAGKIIFRAGGVGHNIAVHIRRAHDQVSFITAFGSDENASMLRAMCLSDGLDISRAMQADAPSSVYMAIHDDSGDMLTAINDMALSAALTPDTLAPLIPYINDSSLCVLDANLPEDTIIYLAKHLRCPIFCDPVSCEKSSRFLPVLSNLTAIKPNLQEALFMTKTETAEDAARWLIDRGISKVFISMGAKGIYYADQETSGMAAPQTVYHGIQTGAGDAACAGIACALAKGLTTKACAENGVRQAALHLEKGD